MEIKYALARQPGTSHLVAGTPCQDFAAGHAGPGAGCVVLCDGAGSYAESHLAADAVSRALAPPLAEEFDSWYAKPPALFAEDLLQLARAAVAAAAPEAKPACTLLLFAAAADGRTLLAHLGDGVIFGVGEEPLVLSKPENGAELNLTYFVSSNNAAAHLRLQKDCLPAGGVALLCSDGAAAALLNCQTDQPAQAVRIIAGWLRQAPADAVEQRLNLELDELFRNYTEDDMSLALLAVPGAAPPPEATPDPTEDEPELLVTQPGHTPPFAAKPTTPTESEDNE